VDVLSTPQILTSDNEEAEILVGENVPFISQRERDVTTTSTVLNSIERTDVGIKLKITPQITEGNFVKLDLFQEISAVKNASDEILTTIGPTTTKRSTKTSVVVKDGSTVVIGGLMQEIEEVSEFKVPLLGDIPFLEWLFKFKSTSKNKKNLLVFLSPHIVKESEQLASITEHKHKEFVEKEKFYYSSELLVKFREDVPDEQAREIISQRKATVIKHFRAIHVYHIELRSGEDVDEAIDIFSTIPEVQYAEPNYKLKIKIPEGSDASDDLPRQPESTSGAPSQRNDIQETELPATAYKAAPSVQVINAPEPSSAQVALILREDLLPDTAELSIVAPGEAPRADGGAEVAEAADTADTLIEEAPGDQSPHQETAAVPVSVEGDNDADVTAPSPEEPGDEDLPRAKKHYIQLGAWVNNDYALETWNRLRNDYRDIYIVREGKFNIVRIPGTASRKQDASIMYKLRKRYRLKPILVDQTI
jgi:cell division septation protein DedD